MGYGILGIGKYTRKRRKKLSIGPGGMMEKRTADLHIADFKALITPDEIRKELPMDASCIELVVKSRQIISDIIKGKDKRKFIIVGPCSIHDPASALEYAEKLSKLAKEVSDTFVL